jgi:predicted nucleic acid-binding protein
MPETVQGYHFLQLCGREAEEGLEFAEYETDIGHDGFGVEVLYGADTGRRHWAIKYPSLAGSSGAVSVTYRGVTMTPAAYLWALFCDRKVDGQPIVVTSTINNQYYLAKFADRKLTYSRFLTKLFSTGIEFKQVRIPGVSVFDFLLWSGDFGWYYGATGPFGLAWEDHSGNDNLIGGQQGLDFVEDVQNGLGVLRFDAVTESALTSDMDKTLYDALLVMQFREATFPNFMGVLSSDVTSAAIVSNNSGTKFFDQSFTDYEYRKNGIQYAASNQQAPMNQFALVHCHWETGRSLTNLQLGKDRDYTDRYADMDLGEVVLSFIPRPPSDIREAAEHLRAFSAHTVIIVDVALILAAVARATAARIAFWDGLIVEAALAAGCTRLLTEDLQDGRDFDGLRVVNPFTAQGLVKP